MSDVENKVRKTKARQPGDPMRITLLVDEELSTRLNKTVPHGFRKHIMVSLITTVLDAIDADGEMMMGALMAGQYKLVRIDDREAAL